MAAEAERGAEDCGGKDSKGGQQERGTKFLVRLCCAQANRPAPTCARRHVSRPGRCWHPASQLGAGAQLAAATRASWAWRVQVSFCGSSTAWPPAASILALAEALKAAALMVRGACSSPVPST